MEEIPCVGLDALDDAGFRKRCADEAKSLSRKKWLLAISVSPFTLAISLVAFGIPLAMIGLEGVIAGFVSRVFSGLLGALVSEGVVGTLSSLIFWAFELLLLASGAMFSIATLALIYYPIKSLIFRDAYIARKIILAKDPEEVKAAALPYIAVFRIYLYFMGIAGRAGNLRSGDLSYARGAVVLKTPAFTFAYGSDYRIRMNSGRGYDEFRIEGIDVEELDAASHTAFVFRDALAIVGKKDRDALRAAIARVDPDALRRGKG